MVCLISRLQNEAGAGRSAPASPGAHYTTPVDQRRWPRRTPRRFYPRHIAYRVDIPDARMRHSRCCAAGLLESAVVRLTKFLRAIILLLWCCCDRRPTTTTVDYLSVVAGVFPARVVGGPCSSLSPARSQRRRPLPIPLALRPSFLLRPVPCEDPLNLLQRVPLRLRKECSCEHRGGGAERRIEEENVPVAQKRGERLRGTGRGGDMRTGLAAPT